MKLWFVGLLAICTLSAAQAQTVYVGGSLALLTEGRYSAPLLGIQLGAELVENLELRATVETVVATSSLGADLLYRVSLRDGFSTYGGVGPEVLFLPLTQTYALRGTLGLEVRTGQVGFFGEAQPLLTLADLHLGYAKFRTGVNYFF